MLLFTLGIGFVLFVCVMFVIYLIVHIMFWFAGVGLFGSMVLVLLLLFVWVLICWCFALFRCFVCFICWLFIVRLKLFVYCVVWWCLVL